MAELASPKAAVGAHLPHWRILHRHPKCFNSGTVAPETGTVQQEVENRAAALERRSSTVHYSIISNTHLRLQRLCLHRSQALV